MANEIIKANVGSLMSEGVGASYCSIQASDRKSAAKIFAALNNPDERVANCINQTILVSDVLIEIAEIANEDTGEISTVPRVVLIDKDGKTYQAVSLGMFNAVKNAIQVFGAPTWVEPLEFTIRQKAVRNGSMLTADVR